MENIKSQLNWTMIDSMLSDKDALFKHQIESYNNFVHVDLPEIFKRYNPIIVASEFDNTNTSKSHPPFRKYCEIRFGQVYISKPVIQENYQFGDNQNSVGYRPLYPKEARLRNLTYASPVFIDIDWKYSYYQDNERLTKSATEKKLLLFRLPVMVGSDICYLSGERDNELQTLYDDNFNIKGYFIVGGGEKVIVSQERHTDNKVCVYNRAPNLVAEIKSSIDQRFYPIKVAKVILTKEPKSMLMVEVSNTKEPIPLFLMLRALGMTNDRDIFHMILEDMDNAPVNYINILYETDIKTKAKLKQYHDLEINQQGIKSVYSNYPWHSQLFALYVLGQYYFKIKFDPNTLSNVDETIQLIRDFIHREVLQHVGQSLNHKANYMCLMSKRILDVYFKVRPYDNRDHYSNKRLNTAGYLLSQLFKIEFIRLTKTLKQNILQFLKSNTTNKDNSLSMVINKHIRSSNIESRFRYSLSTGNWSSNKLSNSSKGISQVLQRISYLATLSHLRRLQSPIDSAGKKITPPRHLHGTQFAYICANETPEGCQVGMVKNLALSSQVTVDCVDYPVRIALKQLGMIDLDQIDYSMLPTAVKVFINGDWLGIFTSEQVKSAYDNLKKIKRFGVINPFISIAWSIEWQEINIQTDGGRYVRPFYIVDENGQLLLFKYLNTKERLVKFQEMLKNKQIDWYDLINCHWFDKLKSEFGLTGNNPGSLVEYLDTPEIESSLIAESPEILNNNGDKYIYRYTHCEIHPILMLGIVGSLIPYSDHNPAPRNCYQSSMGKQAISIYSAGYNERLDTNSHVLVYGHRPLVETRISRYIGMDKNPHGGQVITAFLTYTGYNVEDSVILNESSVQRGLFNTLFFRTYKDEEKKHRSNMLSSERFGMPPVFNKDDPKNRPIRDSDDGLPRLDSIAKGDYNIIGKYTVDKNEQFLEENCTQARHSEHGVIDCLFGHHTNLKVDQKLDKVDKTNDSHYMPNRSSDDNRLVKVRLSQARQPQIGDKFASRCAQKGTTGMLYPASDMPYSANGLIPDLIFNPHGLPTRMTVGMLLEMVLSRVAVNDGRMKDGTPFVPQTYDPESETRQFYRTVDLPSYMNYLEKIGIERHSNEVMYNGFTGEMFYMDIFVSPCFYQRLKHMVDDKLHSRESGQVQMLTRQPAEGRSRDGGLRVGEMERDVLIAYGTSCFLKEKLTDSSDLFKMFVSKKHQTFIVGNESKGLFKHGEQHLDFDDVREVQLPYAMKLLWQEITSMGIDMRIVT